MSKKRILLAAALTLAFVAAAALVLEFEAPVLGEAVTDRIRDATGLACETASSRFQLRRGLVLESLRCSTGFRIGGYEIEAERLVLQHRLLPLFRGRIALREIVLETPRVKVDLGSGPGENRPSPPIPRVLPPDIPRIVPPEKVPGSAASEPRSVEIDFVPSSIRIRNGDIVVPDRFSLQDLDLTLERLVYDRGALTPLHALTSGGSITIGEIGFGSFGLRDVSAKLSTGSGRFRLAGLSLASDRGMLEGELEVDFNSLPFRYRTSLTGAIQAASLEGALRLKAEGFGTAKENVKGSGTFELGKGKFPDAPWVRDVEPALVGRAYSPAEIRFEVREGAVNLEPFELDSPPYILEIGGPVALDGSRLPRFNLRRGERSGAPRSAPREARTGTAPRRE